MAARLCLDGVARSAVGRRSNNEDAVFMSSRLAAVADGVGGAAAGEVASWAVIHSLQALEKRWLDEPLEVALAAAIRDGNAAIGFVGDCRPATAGMGTTVTAVSLSDDGELIVANVGDSRTYLLRNGVLTQLTRDESLVQELVEGGHISAAEARGHPQRSVVLRALDGASELAPTQTTIAAARGDRLLVCSDGLTD